MRGVVSLCTHTHRELTSSFWAPRSNRMTLRLPCVRCPSAHIPSPLRSDTDYFMSKETGECVECAGGSQTAAVLTSPLTILFFLLAMGLLIVGSILSVKAGTGLEMTTTYSTFRNWMNKISSYKIAGKVLISFCQIAQGEFDRRLSGRLSFIR